MKPGSARQQAGVLSARYRWITLGDLPTVVLLVGQAPLIGWLCTVVWGSLGRDTPSLHFALCLAAAWFGCINACREIVKERAIVEREKLFGLSLSAYVWSRFSVLAWLGAAQVVLLLMAVEWKIAVQGNMLIQLAAMWLVSLTGTGLGLVVSAFARTQERAVGAIPLLLMPQILFSELMVPKEYFSTAVAYVEKAMPVRWGYTIFKELASGDPSWLLVIGGLAILPCMTLVLGLLTTLSLLIKRDV